MRSLLFPALASVVSSSDTCFDETSHMQGLQPPALHKRDTKSVSNLLETAKTMLKNGETPDVVAFEAATLDEIIQNVLPSILDSRNTDQDLLDNYFSRFADALNALAEGNQIVHALNAEETTLSVAHKACRDQEAVRCTTKTECDYAIYELWLTFISEETEVRQIQDRIKTQWCAADANGTLAVFRDEVVGPMHEFVEYMRTYRADYWYDERDPICETYVIDLDGKTAECDALQMRLESKTCQHAIQVREVRAEFARAWQDALDVYLPAVDYVYAMWFDRVQEVKTLAVVRCLLDRTTERNGRPCDEETDEVTQEMTHCEEVREQEDITPYAQVYYEIPACADVCQNRHQVVGQCIPQPPHYPCSAGYRDQEYAELPDVPQAPFSPDNSHCNQRPDCQVCTEMEQPENFGTLCPACSSCTRMEVAGSPEPDMQLEDALVTGNNAGVAAFTGQHWRTCAADPFTCDHHHDD